MTNRLPAAARHALLTMVVAAAIMIGCGDRGSTSAPDPTGAPPTSAEARGPAAADFPPAGNPEVLSDWRQLDVDDDRLHLGDRVVPYTLNTSLFSDYAHKLRTVWLPDGSEPAAYEPEDAFDFPVGTVITKTFYYPLAEGESSDELRVVRVARPSDSLSEPLDLTTVRLLETRILVRREAGWAALPYVWNDDQTEATLRRTGDLIPLTLVGDGPDTPFPYVVPDVNQCSSCHATNHTTRAIQPIGPKARHLNLDIDMGDGPVSQLDLWRQVGLVGELPDPVDLPQVAVWDDETAPVDDRARAYLDINCAHCHNRVGPADTSGLFLEPSTEVGFRLGVCKPPIAAGRGTGGRLVGIDPGEPDASIFVYRMETSDPGSMMPELGRSLAHDEGVALIATWIESLEGDC